MLHLLKIKSIHTYKKISILLVNKHINYNYDNTGIIISLRNISIFFFKIISIHNYTFSVFNLLIFRSQEK